MSKSTIRALTRLKSFEESTTLQLKKPSTGEKVVTEDLPLIPIPMAKVDYSKEECTCNNTNKMATPAQQGSQPNSTDNQVRQALSKLRSIAYQARNQFSFISKLDLELPHTVQEEQA